MSTISFKSLIKPVSNAQFAKSVANIPPENFVNYPWTINQTAIGQDTYTTGVQDCTAIAITNGQKSVMLHLCPTHPLNQNTDSIIKNISNIIKKHLLDNGNNQSEDLQALVLGTRNDSLSQKLYNKTIDFFKQNQIPTTELKFGNSPTKIAYKTATDEFIISNADIDNAINTGMNNESALKKGFAKINISAYDEIMP